jgi:hypothetical protein
MNVDPSKSRIRHVRTAGVLAVCLSLAGCDDGPTAPRTTNVVPTPTPAPVTNLAGSWQGTYQSCSVDIIGCSPLYAAAASFSQDGSRITGRVTTQSSRLSESALEGTLQDNQLRGTLTVGGERVQATGSANANHVTMTFRDGVISQGTIQLSR